MDNNQTQDNATVANSSEPATPTAAIKEFIEPEISAPVDILAATKFFLQVTGGGDV